MEKPEGLLTGGRARGCRCAADRCVLWSVDKGTVQKVIVLPRDDLQTEELVLEEVEVFKVSPFFSLPSSSSIILFFYFPSLRLYSLLCVSFTSPSIINSFFLFC